MNNIVFVDVVSSAKTVANHAPDVVWPYLIDQASWMKELIIESVAGERNKEGEIKSVTGNPPVEGTHPFFFKTITLVPFRKFLWKAYTEHRGGNYSFTGVEVLRLRDFGGSSVVTFDAYLEVQSETMTKLEIDSFAEGAKDYSVAMWERNFQRLNALLDHA
jgi:hypothetical protein